MLLITDTPSFPADPPTCLSANIDNADACGSDRSTAIDEPWAAAEALAAKEVGATVVDVNDYLCTANRCGVIIGATLVYRDAHHLTATFSQKLGPVLWMALGLTLAD